MKRRRRGRIFVPLDDWSFLKAPYGYTVQMRRADAARHPRRVPSSRERWLSNVIGALFYLVLLAGGVAGWLRGRSALGVLIGLGAAFAGLAAVALLFLFVYGLVHLPGAVVHPDRDDEE